MNQLAEVWRNDPIAFVALVISLLAAGWHFVKHRLDGPRIRVRMYPGLKTEYSLQQTTRSWKRLGAMSTKRGGWSTEVAVVELENYGRTAVTTSEPSLDLGRTKWWRPGRRTIAPQPLESVDSSTDGITRIEPFDRVRYVFDVWQILQPTSGEPPRRPLRLRASIRIAGRRRRRRSPWWTRWRVKPGQVSLISNSVEIRMAAYRALRRHTRRTMTGTWSDMECVEVALGVHERYPETGPAPSREQLEELIVEKLAEIRKPIGLGLVALYVAEDLRHHYNSGS